MKKIALLLIVLLLANTVYIEDIHANEDIDYLVLNIVPIMGEGNGPGDNGSDATECAASGGIWNGLYCDMCPSGQEWNGSTCVSKCSSNEYWNGTTCVKYPICTENQYLSGRVCVDYPTCPTGQYLDRETFNCIGIPFLTDFTKNPQTVIISQAVLNDLETIKSSTDLVFNKGIDTAKFLLKEDKDFVFIPFTMIEKKQIHLDYSETSSSFIDLSHIISGFSIGSNNIFETKGIGSSQILGTAFVELGSAEYNSSNVFDNKNMFANGANDYLGFGFLANIELLSRERIYSFYTNLMLKMGILNKELTSNSSYVPLLYDNENYYSSFSSKIGYVRNFSSNFSAELFLGINWAWLAANNVLIENYLFKLNDIYSVRPVTGLQLNINIPGSPQIVTGYLEARAEYELDSVVVSEDLVEEHAKGYYIISELGITYIPMRHHPFALNGAVTGTYGKIKKSLGAQFQVEYQF